MPGGKPRDPDYWKKRYAALRLMGLCGSCGKNPATGARCPECKMKRPDWGETRPRAKKYKRSGT